MPRMGPKEAGMLLDKQRLGSANESQGTLRLCLSRPERKGTDIDHLPSANYSELS